MCVCVCRNNRTPVESDQEGMGVRSDEEDEWVYPERRASKKPRRDKVYPIDHVLYIHITHLTQYSLSVFNMLNKIQHH